MAASSSSSGLGWKYDVFINFREEDTRRGFVSHLYKALRQKSVNTFIDTEELRKGDEHLTAIRVSRLSIVVFSQNYAYSTWCLKELVEILECHHTKKQIVLPIFYEVDPSDICQVKGSFVEAFAKLHSNVDVKEVQSWRSALARATDLAGWKSQDYENDAKLIEEIVECVIGRLIPISPTPSKDDGLESTGCDRLMAASFSSSGLRWKYDVFINFKVEGTHRDFVSSLYRALRQKPINAFIAEDLRKGDDLSELLTVIRESRISIVVFSQNYASSTWCLKELVEMLECKDSKNQIVLPIFYRVDPSDIRKVKGSFSEAFAKHVQHPKEEVQSWRSALAKATDIPGWVSQYEDESKLIEKIVDVVFGKLMHISSTSSKDNGLFEMDSHMREMNLLLHPSGVEMNDVRVVGIWGMGGLGKTTIARAVYNEINYQFEACCFLENVTEGFMKHGKLHMRKQLLWSILGNKVGSSDISNEGFHVMLRRLSRIKVLVVVDDVDDLAQIEALLGYQHYFGGGSKIIITTRDMQLLHRADVIYRPEFLSDVGALKLFRWYAFRRNQPTRDYDDLSMRVIHFAQGLPLALKVLGAFLNNKTVREWEDVLEEKRKIPQREIHDVLRTSFDGLEVIEKVIFLDIACFFKGMGKDYATEILDCCGFYPHTVIEVLIDRALITVSREGKLEMHDLLEKMGREIVRQESIKAPGRRSRLWSYEDVHRVLTQNQATKAVESIILDLSNSNEVCLNAEAFVSMTKLRLLKICHKDSHFGLLRQSLPQRLIGDLNFLSHKLRCLSWIGFPLKSLPSNFRFENLVDLDMQYSLIDRLWEGTQMLKNLKFINLSHCQYLKETPDFTMVPNLEKLILQSCMSLIEVHPSISTLTNLVLLNLNGCKELKILASSIRMKSLKTLDLSGCSSLEMFPEILEVMKELSSLNLSGTNIKELPSSINYLLGLSYLDLKDCKEIKSLPSSIWQLKYLTYVTLSGCTKFEVFPSIEENMEGLRELHLDGTSIKELSPSIERLQGLKVLNLRDCKSLVHLPDTLCNLAHLVDLNHCGCTNLYQLPINLRI